MRKVSTLRRVPYSPGCRWLSGCASHAPRSPSTSADDLALDRLVIGLILGETPSSLAALLRRSHAAPLDAADQVVADTCAVLRPGIGRSATRALLDASRAKLIDAPGAPAPPQSKGERAFLVPVVFLHKSSSSSRSRGSSLTDPGVASCNAVWTASMQRSRARERGSGRRDAMPQMQWLDIHAPVAADDDAPGVSVGRTEQDVRPSEHTISLRH